MLRHIITPISRTSRRAIANSSGTNRTNNVFARSTLMTVGAASAAFGLGWFAHNLTENRIEKKTHNQPTFSLTFAPNNLSQLVSAMRENEKEEKSGKKTEPQNLELFEIGNIRAKASIKLPYIAECKPILKQLLEKMADRRVQVKQSECDRDFFEFFYDITVHNEFEMEDLRPIVSVYQAVLHLSLLDEMLGSGASFDEWKALVDYTTGSK